MCTIVRYMRYGQQITNSTVQCRWIWTLDYPSRKYLQFVSFNKFCYKSQMLLHKQRISICWYTNLSWVIKKQAQCLPKTSIEHRNCSCSNPFTLFPYLLWMFLGFSSLLLLWHLYDVIVSQLYNTLYIQSLEQYIINGKKFKYIWYMALVTGRAWSIGWCSRNSSPANNSKTGLQYKILQTIVTNT